MRFIIAPPSRLARRHEGTEGDEESAQPEEPDEGLHADGSGDGAVLKLIVVVRFLLLLSYVH